MAPRDREPSPSDDRPEWAPGDADLEEAWAFHTARARRLMEPPVPGGPAVTLLRDPHSRHVAGDTPAALHPRVAVASAFSPSPPEGGVATGGALDALPFRRSALATALSKDAYRSVPPKEIPLALAALHHSLMPGAPMCLALSADANTMRGHEGEVALSGWNADTLNRVLEGAGFNEVALTAADGAFVVSAVRARTLPDFVAGDMRLLICGLNPSLVAADAGYGFAGASNRFWKAAVNAGVVSRPGDPWHALSAHRVGMTDMVKRPTPRAAGITRPEFRVGWQRIEWLAGWLKPRALCFVGLQGWRAAVNGRATPGWQPEDVGGVPAYVMPSTSGLNTRSTPVDLADHLGRALAGPDR